MAQHWWVENAGTSAMPASGMTTHPLIPACSCLACTSHSRAYIHHLIRSDELLGLTLLSLHNITHLVRFTNAMAQAIQDGCFSEDFAPWQEDSPAHHTW
jgi:queuine tRNA-ribosyltransferase